MAVEMADLLICLVTTDRERPFTFLDHALRCGDSLLGISDVGQLKKWSLAKEQSGQIGWFELVISRALAVALKLRRQIEARPVEVVADAEEKEQQLREA